MSKSRRKWIAAAAVLLYLLLDSQFRLSLSHYTVESRKLPEAFDGLCILQLSDLHGQEFGPGSRRLLRSVSELAPDMIAVTGDLLDESSTPEVMLTLAENLRSLAPCYFVTGNHEWARGDVSQLKAELERRGITVLDNRWETLSKDGQVLIVGGVDDPNGPADMITPEALTDRIREVHPDAFLLLLAHRNDFPERYPFLDADLILCGHGHGGLIRLPWVGGLFGTDRCLFPSYAEGIFHGAYGSMVVSRGLGNSPGTFRFLNNPEIVIVHLKKI